MTDAARQTAIMARAIALRREGLSYRSIAKRLDIGVKTAFDAVRKGLAEARRAREG